MKLKPGTLILAAIVMLLTACASLLGPREVELPVAKLQDALNRKFPFNSRYLELLAINVSNPRLTLQPETNRVMTTLDATIAPLFLKNSWKGSVTVSGTLALDSARSAVVLTEPRMENFMVDGVDAAYTNQVARIGGLLAEQVFRNATLYTFDADSFRYGGSRFMPTKITTKSNALVVTFEPVK